MFFSVFVYSCIICYTFGLNHDFSVCVDAERSVGVEWSAENAAVLPRRVLGEKSTLVTFAFVSGFC